LENKREVSYEEGEKFARDHGLGFIETSAKNNESIEEAFMETAKKIYDKAEKGELDTNTFLNLLSLVILGLEKVACYCSLLRGDFKRDMN